MEVLPVTDSILVLHYREGHIEYNGVRPDGSYAPQGENTVHYSPLNIEAATDVSRYRISSTSHDTYTGGGKLAPRRTANAEPLLHCRQRVHNSSEPSVVHLRDRLSFKPGSQADLASVSPDGSIAARSRYNSDFIGESRDAESGFGFVWESSQSNLKGGDEVLITAIAHDKRGEASAPIPGGEQKFRISGLVNGSKQR